MVVSGLRSPWIAHGLGLLVLARLLLGMGEGAAFPAATRVIAKWLPGTKRATAMGIINAGTAVDSVLAPPVIGLILLLGSWRYVFFFAGSLGIAWAIGWAAIYRPPAKIASGNPIANTASTPWLKLLSSGKVISMVDIVGNHRLFQPPQIEWLEQRQHRSGLPLKKHRHPRAHQL
jgi:MFS transporter, ACS family, hexuronate transporter